MREQDEERMVREGRGQGEDGARGERTRRGWYVRGEDEERMVAYKGMGRK